MGKVIINAIFAFFVVFCASCRSLHTNYQTEENLATHAKFETSQIRYGNLTELFGRKISLSDSAQHNTKVKIIFYDTLLQQGNIQIYPTAQVQIEEEAKEIRVLASQDTQVVSAADTSIFQAQIHTDTQESTSEKKVKTNADIVVLLLLAAAVFGVIQIFRQK